MKIEKSRIGRIAVPDQLPPHIALFYTTIDFPGRLDPSIVAELMAVVRDLSGIDASLTTCSQVHGVTVSPARREGAWRECDSCDALWSAETGVALAIKVADCLPVTLIDPVIHVIANVHSGWRGAVQRITAATINKVVTAASFEPSRSFAYLGPSIRECCFEVGEEVVDQFAGSYDNAAQFVRRDRKKPHIDLPGLTAALLRSRGFASDRIIDSGLCTRCEGSIFHSFRRDGTGGGRNLAVVAQ